MIFGWNARTFKVIPEKKTLLINFLETFPECSPPSTVSKKAIKMIRHHSRLKPHLHEQLVIWHFLFARVDDEK